MVRCGTNGDVSFERYVGPYAIEKVPISHSEMEIFAGDGFRLVYVVDFT